MKPEGAIDFDMNVGVNHQHQLIGMVMPAYTIYMTEEETEKLIEDLYAALANLAVERDRPRKEAQEKIWNALTPEERSRRMESFQKAWREAVNGFWDSNPLMDALRRREKK